MNDGVLRHEFRSAPIGAGKRTPQSDASCGGTGASRWFVPITSFTRFEVIQALRFEAWRYRNDRSKGLPADQVEGALNLFLAEIGSSFQLVPILWETVFAQAELFTRSTPEKGWRTVDLVHVATATSLQAAEFFSFDEQQNHLARGQRLKTPLLKPSA